MVKLPLLNCPEVASIFVGGIISPNRLNHPEGIIVDPDDGALWCGGEAGELYRVSPDGSSVREIASSGGFALGLCMDSQRRIYMCDLAQSCVVVFEENGNEFKRLTAQQGDHSLDIPNYPVLSLDERYLYVSNTCRPGGPGIWRFDLTDGNSTLWMDKTCYSANGLAMAPDGSGLYLVESHLPGICFIPINPDGSAGEKRISVSLPQDEPDGLAFAPDGSLWISIYNPSRIYRFFPATGQLDLIVQDDSTDYIHHATNIAFRGPDELFCANLGAWHLTRIDLKALT